MESYSEIEKKLKQLNGASIKEVSNYIDFILYRLNMPINFKANDQHKPWMDLAGSLNNEDALQMKKIIDYECERIDDEHFHYIDTIESIKW